MGSSLQALLHVNATAKSLRVINNLKAAWSFEVFETIWQIFLNINPTSLDKTIVGNTLVGFGAIQITQDFLLRLNIFFI